MTLLPIPALVNQNLSLERKSEIQLTDNFKNIVYHINLMSTLIEHEESKKKFKIIMRSIINEPEILLINTNFRNIIIRKINEFISEGIFNEDHEFIALREEINNILISITL